MYVHHDAGNNSHFSTKESLLVVSSEIAKTLRDFNFLRDEIVRVCSLDVFSPLFLLNITIYMIWIIVRVCYDYHIIQNYTKLVIKIVVLGILNQE